MPTTPDPTTVDTAGAGDPTALQAARAALLELVTHGPHPGLGDSDTLDEVAAERRRLAKAGSARNPAAEYATPAVRLSLLTEALADVARVVAVPDALDSPRDELIHVAAVALAWLDRCPRATDDQDEWGEEPPF